MNGPWFWIAKKELRDRYPTPWALGGELAALVLSLTIYWYTARAFAPAFEKEAGTGYFSYLLTGELALFIPLIIFDGISRTIRQLAAQGTLEPLLLSPCRPQTSLSLFALAFVPRELSRILLTLVLAAAIFGLRADGASLLAAGFLQALALPAFIGLGFIAAAAMIVLGRGDSALSYLGTGAAVLAGAYFPISVLPLGLQKLGASFSPFTLLLEATRAAVSGHWNMTELFHFAVPLALWGAGLFGLGYLAIGVALQRARRTGSPLLFTGN